MSELVRKRGNLLQLPHWLFRVKHLFICPIRFFGLVYPVPLEIAKFVSTCQHLAPSQDYIAMHTPFMIEKFEKK